MQSFYQNGACRTYYSEQFKIGTVQKVPTQISKKIKWTINYEQEITAHDLHIDSHTWDNIPWKNSMPSTIRSPVRAPIVKAEAWSVVTFPTTTVSCMSSPCQILRAILSGWVYTSATSSDATLESLFLDCIGDCGQSCVEGCNGSLYDIHPSRQGLYSYVQGKSIQGHTKTRRSVGREDKTLCVC